MNAFKVIRCQDELQTRNELDDCNGTNVQFDFNGRCHTNRGSTVIVTQILECDNISATCGLNEIQRSAYEIIGSNRP